jgi:cell division septation protein DedD
MIVGRIESAEGERLVRHCFSALMGLVADLHDASAEDATGDCGHAPSVIASVAGSASALIEHVEEASAGCESLKQNVEEALIGVCFALRHEVRRAVELDLSKQDGDDAQPGAHQGRVAQAYNVLCNCFQQCVGLLARSLDPAFDECDLFDDARLRLEQSVRLRDALVSLVKSIKDAEGGRYPQSAVTLIGEVEEFRRDHMRHLMRRDWETFDGFVNEIVSTREQKTFTGAAKKFLAYLETLLAHVQMREVLKDLPAAAMTAARATPTPKAKAKAATASVVTAAAPPAPRAVVRAYSASAPASRGWKKPAAWAAAAASVLLTCGVLFSSRLSAEGGIVTSLAEASNGAEAVSAPAAADSVAPSIDSGARPEEAKADARASAPPRQAGGELTIQVGAYKDAASANSAAASLAAKGVDARVSKGNAPRQGVVFRVQVGRFGSRAEATRVGGQLKAKGAVRTYLIAETE